MSQINPEAFRVYENEGYVPGKNCRRVIKKYTEHPECIGVRNARDFDRHLTIAAEISERFDIPEDKVYLLFSISARKPLDKFEKNSELYNNILKRIANSLNKNERITAKMIEFWLCEEGIPLKTKTVSPGKVAKKVNLPDDLIQTGSIKTRIQALKSVLTTGQISILNDIMMKYDHDDELGAISLALIWAKERMENE